MRPYYVDDWCAIYHGDCLDLLPHLERPVPGDSLLTDVPYGIGYESGAMRVDGNARSIVGDEDTYVRDWILRWWGEAGPALVFGSWRVPKPAGTKGVLVWDKGGALGMGDLSMPWKFDHEEVYVLGRGFTGKRDSGSVLRHPPEQARGRLHPHQKPVGLMSMLLAKLPHGRVFDPCMGVGSTLVAAKARGMMAVGIEKDEGYCEKAARRLSQAVLDFGGAA